MSNPLTQNKKNDRRKPPLDLSTMVYGKIPPQAKEVEEAILGCCLLETNAFDVVADILKPEAFYVDAHQRIFKAMQQISAKGSIVELLSVVQQLKANEELEMVGGAYYISKLTNTVFSTANLETWCMMVMEKFLQRELIRIGGETLGKAYEESTDVFELIDEVDRNITDLTVGNLHKSYSTMSTNLTKSITRIEELRKIGKELAGIPSGFPAIDKVTHGWQEPDLIILAARPSVGKTAFALNIARNAATNSIKPVPVGFFSLEMKADQLVNRLLSAESGIWMEKLITGNLTDEHMQKLYREGVAKLQQVPIFIDDSHGLTLYDLRTRARNMKRKEKIGLLIIDYLQLMGGDKKSGNREQEISTISRGLKGLAKELQIPIIALSQLSRETEKRTGEKKMPQLSDLRESGAIEQDADMVMFMYRPEYYNQGANEWGETTAGETIISFGKNRSGVLDKIKLRAELSIQKFHSWDGVAAVTEQLGKGSWKPIKDVMNDEPF